MGALTFTQMQTLVKRTINNRDDLDTEIGQAINNAYLQTSMIRGVIFRELDAAPQVFPTVVNVAWYEFSSILTSTKSRDLMAVFSIKNMTTIARLRPTSVQDIEGKGSGSGAPRWFAHYKEGILLHPSPDAVYSLSMRYRLRPNRLSASGDVTVMPEEYDWAIVWGAASDINATIGVLDKSSFYATKRREALEIVGVAAEIEDQYEDFNLAPDLS
jgi:hypothetical protein